MNGIYDIENLTFKEGIDPNDFIERTLPYNYYKIKDLKKEKEYIKKIFTEICNSDSEHFNYIITLYAYSMLGIPHYEKAFYNQIGSFGDGGKSKIMEIIKIVFLSTSHHWIVSI